MSDFAELVDLASERLGGVALAANDEFFAPKERLLAEGEPEFRPDEYTERGKWMDGWETRRRRESGHDWCLIRLGLRGVVRGVDVDTRHFKGNFPESFSLAAADLEADPAPGGAEPVAPWRELVAPTPLAGDRSNLHAVAWPEPVTHLLLRIFPDGGVARLRVWGEVRPDWRRLAARGEVDLAAVEHGGRVVAASDMFFGHRHHLIYPGPSRGMFDGWETRRRRGPGHDWAIVALGAAGRIRRVEVDTTHFKGNAPGACSLEATESAPGEGAETAWREILPRQPLAPDSVRIFAAELVAHAPVRAVRFNIFPDGGVARLRLFGEPAVGA